MNITLESDYAIRIVAAMAKAQSPDSHGRGAVPAGVISASTGVTPRFALKILRKLVQADIAKSFRGAEGGYALARSPSEITLRDVIEAIDGEFTLSRCLSDHSNCTNPDTTLCRFRRDFERISNVVRSELDKINFAVSAE